MSDLKKPPSPRSALNIVLNGHGATCSSYALSCKKCEREHEAVLVLRALIEASEAAAADSDEDDGLPECVVASCNRVAAHCAEHIADGQHEAWLRGWHAGSGGEDKADNPFKKLPCNCESAHCPECGEDPAIVGYP